MENTTSFEYYNTPSDYLQGNITGKYLSLKPKNTLDYLAYNDAEYSKYKLTEKIKTKLMPFNFDLKVVTEIIQICFKYQSQFKLSVLLPIVIYKIIHKHNFPITMIELSSKINFDKSNYLKYSSQIVIKRDHQSSYKDNVYNYISFIISKLIEVTRLKPRIIKYTKNNKREKTKDKELDDLFKKYASSSQSKEGAFEDSDRLFNAVKSKCKEYIYSQPISLIGKKNDDEDEDFFNKHFEKKIIDKHLSIAIVKAMMKKEGISINSADLRDLFAVSLSSISKGISFLKEYDKLNGLLFYKGDD